MKKAIAIGLCGLLILTGCGRVVPTMENGDEVVAELNGKQISATDLYKEIKADYGTNYLVNMIDDYILSQELTKEEFDDAKDYAKEEYEKYVSYYNAQEADFDELILNYYPSVDAFKTALESDYKKQKAVEKFLKRSLTDEEIETYYEKEIEAPMTVRHILIIPDITDGMSEEEKGKAEDTAYATALDLIKQLNDGADFATLAQTYSEDTGTAKNGGLFENFEKETTDAAFWQAAYNLENNEITQTPVESSYGYHIIQKVSSGEKPSLENSLEKIEKTLVAKKMTLDNAIDIYLVQLRESYNMTIYDTDVEKEYKDTINTLEE